MELVGLDIFTWSPEAGAGHVLEFRALNERLSWNVSINLGGRRQVATEIVPALDIRGVDSLAELLEGLNSMIVCSGVPSRAGGAVSHFSARLKPFCPRSPPLTIPMELVIHLLKRGFPSTSKTLLLDAPAYRQPAADIGGGFLVGSKARVETCRFQGFDGPVDWTIRSTECDLLISRRIGRNCGGCDLFGNNMRARLSHHNNGGGLQGKKDPKSRARLSLIGPELMRERMIEQTKLLKLSEEREKALVNLTNSGSLSKLATTVACNATACSSGCMLVAKVAIT